MEAIDPENEEITKTWSFDYNGQMEDGFMVGILGFRNTTFQVCFFFVLFLFCFFLFFSNFFLFFSIFFFQVPLECFGSCIKG